MAHYITPHTPQWFTCLARFDPTQATQTKHVIKLAGTDQCCSICGDKEAVADYYLDAKDVPDDAVLTLRLCRDCKGIRAALDNENFLPFPDKSAQ